MKLKQLAMSVVVSVVAMSGALMFAPAKANAAVCYYQVIGYGNAGTCVKFAQIMMNSMTADGFSTGGYILAADGIYGWNTRNMAYKTQVWFNSWHSFKISQDGVIGRQTWTVLCTYAAQDPMSGYWQNQAKAVAPYVCPNWY